jgi:hypothetical protein
MKNLLLFFLIILPALAFGQDSISYAPLITTRPPVVVDQGVVLKVAPLSLIDLDPTVQVAVEIPLRQKWSIQQEVGYGWPKLDWLKTQDAGLQPHSTFRARTEIRYYFSPDLLRNSNVKKGPAGFYLSGEGMYKKLTAQESAKWELFSGPVLTGPVSQTKKGTARHVYGLHAKVGFQGAISAKNPRLIVDVYVGAGFRLISVRQAGQPLDHSLTKGDWVYLNRFTPFVGILPKPSLAGGVKIGWMINSGKKIKKK